MNLFKKDPQKLFEVVAAVSLVVLSAFFVTIFYLDYLGLDLNERYFGPQKKIVPGKIVPANEGTISGHDQIPVTTVETVDYNKFTPVHVVLDAPSYARSNFGINPETDIELYFNRKVDYTSLQNKLYVVEKATNQMVTFDVTLIDRNESDVIDNPNNLWENIWVQKAVLIPEEQLQANKTYKVMALAGYTTANKAESALNNFEYEFMTADDPGFLSSNVVTKTTGQLLKKDSPVSVIFKSPMNLDDILENVEVIPELNTLEFIVNDKILQIKGMEPGEKYTVTIPSYTPDIYGRELGEIIILEFSTQ